MQIHQPDEELSRMFANFLLVAQKTHLLPRRYRARALRMLGFEVGQGATIYEGVFFGSSRFRIGSHVFISIGCFLDGSDKIEIEDDVHLAPGVAIYTSTHDIAGRERRAGAVRTAAVIIGRGAWLGAGATILPGAHIAPGCVVAAGAVVTAPTLPDGLYGGIPAQRLKDLP